MATVQPANVINGSKPFATTAGVNGSVANDTATVKPIPNSSTKEAANVSVSEVSKSRFSPSSIIPLFLDGKETTLSETFDVISPLDQKLLYKCSSASEQDCRNAIDSAQKAFKSWSKTKPSTRRDIFLRALNIFERRRDECWNFLHTEVGTSKLVETIDYGLATNLMKSIPGLIQSAVEGSMPIADEDDASAMIIKEPYGVILAIAPWNMPYILGVRSFLAALAMGNTVVLKGSEISPGVFWILTSIFYEAGLPAGCLNTIYHRPADAAKITSYLIAAPEIKKINFTGSSPVGSIISSQAGKHLKPVLMELGGKNPSIVCEDADIELAAAQCAVGAFLHSGQICMSTDRILVHKKVVESFKEAFKRHTADHWSANGAGVQLVNAAPVQKNHKMIKDALSKGAKTVYGDPSDEYASPTIMRPIIIADVNKDMDIYQTEAFGPTVSIITVSSDDEAIQIANDTDYGLSSAVFTKDLLRGLRIAKQIETGAVHINSKTIHDESALPHGGAKMSGSGRFNGMPGMQEWVRTKVITFKH